MTWWADVNARATGLAGHLLDGPEWRRARTTPDLFTLCRELARLGYPIESGAEPRAAERVIEQVRRQRQALLVRWLGSRSRHLRFVLEIDDRRAIRALLRGAAADLSPSERLAVVPPSVGVSERMAERAALAATPEECVEILADLGQDLAVRTMEELRSWTERWPETSALLALEIALVRAAAARAVEGAKRGGGELERLVALTLDLQNAWSVLVLVPLATPEAESVFVEGGAKLSLDAFREALEAGEGAAARAVLARELPSPASEPFADPTLPPGRLKRRVLALTVRQQQLAARHDPLGPAPVLAFSLRLQLESRDLRGLLWARALGAPLEVPEVV